MNDRQLPSLENPIIDRNPPSSFADLALTSLIVRIKKISGLSQIYCGYSKITEPISFPLQNFGGISILGFQMDGLNSMLRDHGELFLSYIAIPIDDMDNLVENPSLTDWDFEENFLKQIIDTETIPAGAIHFNNKTIKLRTIKFVLVE